MIALMDCTRMITAICRTLSTVLEDTHEKTRRAKNAQLPLKIANASATPRHATTPYLIEYASCMYDTLLTYRLKVTKIEGKAHTV